jgi:hypothetical protein
VHVPEESKSIPQMYRSCSGFSSEVFKECEQQTSD